MQVRAHVFRVERSLGRSLDKIARLRERAHARVDENRCARHRLGIDLAHLRSKCAHEIEMRAGTQPRPLDQRRGAERGAGDHVRLSGAGLQIGRFGVESMRARPVDDGVRLAGGPPPHQNAPDRPDGGVRFDQRGREPPGADHQHHGGVFAREMTRRQRRGGGGPPRRQLAPVEHRRPLAGPRVGDQNLALHRRQSALRIARHDIDQFDDDAAILAPCRHEQEGALGLTGHRDGVVSAGRRRTGRIALCERLRQRGDQVGKRRRAGDIGGGGEQHGGRPRSRRHFFMRT